MVDLAEEVGASTVAMQHRSLRALWSRLEQEAEITANPFRKLREPPVTEKPVPVMNDDDLTAGSRGAVLITPLIVGALATGPQSVGTATAVVTVPSIVGFTVVMAVLRRRSPAPDRGADHRRS